MTRVSRSPLKDKIYYEITETFWELISDLGDERNAKGFFNVFLSKTEKTMLVKRLAIAMMLRAGLGAIEISMNLKVSTSTVRDVSYKLDKENFGRIIDKFSKRFKSRKAEISWLEALFAAKSDMKARAKLYGG